MAWLRGEVRVGLFSVIRLGLVWLWGKVRVWFGVGVMSGFDLA